uniref:COX6C domain-containing protein n=1 Tax=Mesocestoides corti TaxID=53468 RepID=A0A5K3EY73_MESCO
MYDSPANMPKLRYHYRNNSIKGLIFALSLASGITAVVSYYMYQRKIVTARRFYETYDPDLEWNRLLKSGILKTVDKDGNFIDLSD